MNKKLVAVAVAGLLATPMAAFAQTANVTLYGIVNLDYELVNGKQIDGSNPNSSRLSSNSSRFGVRGVESLGGGLNAIFQLEAGVAWDTGGSSANGQTNANTAGDRNGLGNTTNSLAGRESYVGLQGSWGTFKMGNFLAPYDSMHPIFGNVPTYTTSILSTASVWSQGTSSKENGGFDARLGNSLRYDSPVYAGFNGSAQITLRDDSGVPNAGSGNLIQMNRHSYIFDLAGFYNNGPFQGGIAWEHNEKVRGPTLDDDALSVSGAWNFGVIRVAGIYEYLSYDTPTGSLNRNFFGLSGTVPFGPGAFYAFWGRANNGSGGAADGTRVGGLAKGSNTGTDQVEVSYTYPLSKRTQVYTGYVKLINDSNASYNFNINPGAGYAVGSKPQGLVFGMIHLF
jgi:predicted porin